MDKKEPYSKRNPFTVPEGYFPQLEKRVMRRIGSELKAGQVVGKGMPFQSHPGPRAARLPLRKRLLPFIGAAASIAIVAFIAQTWPDRGRDEAEAQQLDHMISKEYAEQGAESAYDYLLLDNETIYEYATEE